RKFAKLKESLMPYLWAEAVETHRTGVPMLRPMVLACPGDRICADLDTQYMLGSSLLVAPVFTESGDVEYYLPAGRWTGLLDGRELPGGRFVREVHDFFSLPLMVRENTLLPMRNEDGTLTVRAYAVTGEAACDVREEDALFRVSVKRSGTDLVFDIENGPEDLSLLLVNERGEAEVTGGEAIRTDEGLHIRVTGETVTIRET
ncbi:MAG: alpha-xylosidase, partial [Clostridiales bacterium]|nr:alpha-xylosidase [Clostridiales bacterium]